MKKKTAAIPIGNGGTRLPKLTNCPRHSLPKP